MSEEESDLKKYLTIADTGGENPECYINSYKRVFILSGTKNATLK